MFCRWFYLVENQKGKIENPEWHFYLSIISKSLKWVKCLLFNVANFNPWNFAVEAINKSIASLVLRFFFKFLWRLIVVSIISLVNGRISTFSKNVCQKVSWSALLPFKTSKYTTTETAKYWWFWDNWNKKEFDFSVFLKYSIITV